MYLHRNRSTITIKRSMVAMAALLGQQVFADALYDVQAQAGALLGGSPRFAILLASPSKDVASVLPEAALDGQAQARRLLDPPHDAAARVVQIRGATVSHVSGQRGRAQPDAQDGATNAPGVLEVRRTTNPTTVKIFSTFLFDKFRGPHE